MRTSVPQVNDSKGCYKLLQKDATAHSVREYSKDSYKIVMDYTLLLYLVSVSLIMTYYSSVLLFGGYLHLFGGRNVCKPLLLSKEYIYDVYIWIML